MSGHAEIVFQRDVNVNCLCLCVAAGATRHGGRMRGERGEEGRGALPSTLHGCFHFPETLKVCIGFNSGARQGDRMPATTVIFHSRKNAPLCFTALHCFMLLSSSSGGMHNPHLTSLKETASKRKYCIDYEHSLFFEDPMINTTCDHHSGL